MQGPARSDFSLGATDVRDCVLGALAEIVLGDFLGAVVALPFIAVYLVWQAIDLQVQYLVGAKLAPIVWVMVILFSLIVLTWYLMRRAGEDIKK